MSRVKAVQAPATKAKTTEAAKPAQSEAPKTQKTKKPVKQNTKSMKRFLAAHDRSSTSFTPPEEYILERAKPNKLGGVVYMGHLPLSMTEQPLKKFLAQFGEVKRIQLSRSPKTGKYRGYGFVEFSDKQVAAIVAETMDKYMLKGKTISCQYIPFNQLHSETFRNNFREFYRSTARQDHRLKHDQVKTADEALNARKFQVSTLLKKQKAMEALGYSLDNVCVTMNDEKINVKNIKEEAQLVKKQKTKADKKDQKLVQLPTTTTVTTKSTIKGKAKAAEVIEEKPAPKKATAKKAAPIVEEIVDITPVAKKTAAKKAAPAPVAIEEPKKVTKTATTKKVAAKVAEVEVAVVEDVTPSTRKSKRSAKEVAEVEVEQVATPAPTKRSAKKAAEVEVIEEEAPVRRTRSARRA